MTSAISEVIEKAQLLIGQRVELFRVEARDDIRQVLQAVALGGVALVVASVAVVAGAAATVWILSIWIPMAASLLTVAVLSAAAAGGLGYAAIGRLPGRSAAEKPALTEGHKAELHVLAAPKTSDGQEQ